MPSKNGPQVRVEGRDDKHALLNLLVLHGIGYDNRRGELPVFYEAGGVDELLDSIGPTVRTNATHAVGFVLDADSSSSARWHRIRQRLADVDVDAGETLPPAGFIGVSTKYKTRVGVWLMPDNSTDGELEDFLRLLVNEGDELLALAEKSSDEARSLGATFPAVARPKAVLHAWLAWQEQPGMPYGTAIRARYFERDSEVATAFVDWYRRLFEIE